VSYARIIRYIQDVIAYRTTKRSSNLVTKQKKGRNRALSTCRTD